MLNLLYVSESLIPSSNASEEIHALVRTSIDNNARNEITGALIYTGTHFAQALDGPAGRVQSLMDTIRTDQRHQHVTTVQEVESEASRFRYWSMAYSGQATFVCAPIQTLMVNNPPDKDLLILRVYELMEELIRTPQRTVS